MAAIELGTWHTRAGYVGDVACTRSLRSIALRGAAGETDMRTILASAGRRLKKSGDADEEEREGEVVPLWSLRSFQQDTDTHVEYLRHLKNDVLGCASLEDPLLLVVPELWHERLDVMRGIFELVLEDGELTNALYCARPSVSWALSSGKVSAIVLDAGHSHTSVTAVFDGYALRHTIDSSVVGGAAITAAFAEMAETVISSVVAEPHPGPQASDARGAAALLLREVHAADVKRVLGYVSVGDAVGDGSSPSGPPGVSHPLPLQAPDGTTLTLTPEQRCRPFELLFAAGGGGGGGGDGTVGVNVAEMLVQCKRRVDPEWQVRAVHHVLAGGSAMARGFDERVGYELKQRDAAYFRYERDGGLSVAKTVAGAWVGASMAAASSAFNPLWVARAEWEEEGESVLYRKLFY